MKTIPLNKGYSCLVDDEDYDRIKGRGWCVFKTGFQVYARARINNRLVFMHRVIMNAPDGIKVDHINDTHTGMVLDNRKSNLRFASHSLNGRNTHRDRGVWFRKTRNKWVAQAKHKGRVYIVGSYPTRAEAMSELERWKATVGFRTLESLSITPKQPLILTCSGCGRTFETTRKTQRACSSGCRWKSWNKL